MYRRSKFLEVLIEIRQEMAREADFDTDLFAEMIRSGRKPDGHLTHSIVEKNENDRPEKKSIERSART
jgi:hypothetical protein